LRRCDGYSEINRGRSLSLFLSTEFFPCEFALVWWLVVGMIEVVWNSHSAVVVYKPAGLATQAPAQFESVEAELCEQFKSRSNYIALPHRLDRPVSGLLLVAFTKRAARLLGEQFEARRVKKSYLALVEGWVQDESMIWTDWMRKRDDEARVEIVADEMRSQLADAKFAESHVRLIARGETTSLIELQPLTGRMHQLRIQTASRGHAILGDALYGCERRNGVLAEGEIGLQASKIEFNDPANGRRVSVEAPLPAWASLAHG
jgi:RluA family pseudouridine synthase